MKYIKTIISSIFLLLSLHTYAQDKSTPITKAENITGGVEVDIDQRPFQGSVQLGGGHHCGCSVVNDRYVVTAAHCVQGRTAESFRVALGVTEQSQVGSSGQLIDVRNIIRHFNYDPSTLDNDIAILELETAITFNDNVQPVRIINEANRNLINAGQQVTVSGWGWITPGRSSSPNHLREVTVPIITNAEANRQLARLVTDNMIATGYIGNRQGPCHGDSGGPLTGENGAGIPFLVGVVSWGVPTCPEGANSPSVYADVINYQNWIYDNICQQTVSIGSDIFSDVLLEASNSLTYSGTIRNRANAVLRAGQQVILTDGFVARPTGRGDVLVDIGGNCVNTNARTITANEKSIFIEQEAESIQTEVYPNPFTNEATISYFMEETGVVDLALYDLAGRQIKHLIKHEIQQSGNQALKIDASKLSAGTYIYDLSIGRNQTKGKIIKR